VKCSKQTSKCLLGSQWAHFNFTEPTQFSTFFLFFLIIAFTITSIGCSWIPLYSSLKLLKPKTTYFSGILTRPSMLILSNQVWVLHHKLQSIQTLFLNPLVWSQVSKSPFFTRNFLSQNCSFSQNLPNFFALFYSHKDSFELKKLGL